MVATVSIEVYYELLGMCICMVVHICKVATNVYDTSVLCSNM